MLYALSYIPLPPKDYGLQTKDYWGLQTVDCRLATADWQCNCLLQKVKSYLFTMPKAYSLNAWQAAYRSQKRGQGYLDRPKDPTSQK